MIKLNYRIAGDRGLLIKFGEGLDEKILNRIIQFESNFKKSNVLKNVETIKGFCTLYISYDPLKIDINTLISHVENIGQKLSYDQKVFSGKKIIEIPAVYGGKYGPDLPLVSELLDVSEEEVIQRHLSHDYLIYILGHICGAAFFKGKDELFNLPRKKTPVISYPAGSLLFAGGIGSALQVFDGPTGWYNIGRSPLRQWNVEMNPPVLIKAGDRIKYKRIDENQFQKIKRKVNQKTFRLKYL
ncbi:allophanate hydrolase subunit 1 [Thermodesulfobacteriota bacterium]